MNLDRPNFEDLTPNALVDYCFYNVNSLSRAERCQLAWLGKLHNEPPGTVIWVPPHRHGASRIKIDMAPTCSRMASLEADTIVVAGVGSSILGTAALAADVANLSGQPVLGLVSGIGAAGTPLDTVLGAFAYGTINRLDDFALSISRELGLHEAPDDNVIDCLPDPATADPPQHVLRDVLRRKGVLRAIGHSKGALELLAAIDYLSGPGAVPGWMAGRSKLKVGTLGAVVALKQADVDVCQVLGGIDLLGRINSTLDIPHHTIPLRWHSLNTSLPLAMSMADDVWGKMGLDTAFS